MNAFHPQRAERRAAPKPGRALPETGPACRPSAPARPGLPSGDRPTYPSGEEQS